MGKLDGKRVAIVVANEFEDIELLYPLLRLSEEGADIIVGTVQAGHHPRPFIPGKPITGRFGTPVPLEVLDEGKRYRHVDASQLRADDLDAIVIPGGFSPDALRRRQFVLDLVREMDRQGKVIAAICHGPQVLISAGVVRGKRVTSFVAVRDDLINAGANFEDVPAVADGNIITARVPDDLPEFCHEIIRALASS